MNGLLKRPKKKKKNRYFLNIYLRTKEQVSGKSMSLSAASPRENLIHVCLNFCKKRPWKWDSLVLIFSFNLYMNELVKRTAPMWFVEVLSNSFSFKGICSLTVGIFMWIINESTKSHILQNMGNPIGFSFQNCYLGIFIIV